MPDVFILLCLIDVFVLFYWQNAEFLGIINLLPAHFTTNPAFLFLLYYILDMSLLVTLHTFLFLPVASLAIEKYVRGQ